MWHPCRRKNETVQLSKDEEAENIATYRQSRRWGGCDNLVAVCVCTPGRGPENGTAETKNTAKHVDGEAFLNPVLKCLPSAPVQLN